MQTYRDLFRLGEFRALFVAQLGAAASLTVQALALSVLVYARTASALLAAVSFLGASLPQALGATTLAGISDRLPPRRALVASDCARAAACILLAAGVLPVAGMLAVVTASGVASGAFGGVRFAVLTDLIPVDAYVLGRSALNTASAGMQILGYAFGGVFLSTLGPEPALRVASALAVLVCLADRFGLRARPARRTGSVSVAATWRATTVLLRHQSIGPLLFAQWIPNGLIVGAEALFVPYAGQHAGILFAATGGGMLVGDVLVGRWTPLAARTSRSLALYLLLALPYVSFAAKPPIWAAATLVAVASIGYGGTLGVQQQMVKVVPEAWLGHALALASAGMLTAQGLAAYMAGGLADGAPVGAAMAVMAAASVAATVVLIGRLGPRRIEPASLDIPAVQPCQTS
jgi:MFS family permease